MSDEPRVKVTDKRIFTPEGELRQEYRFLDDRPSPEPVTEELNDPVQEPVATQGSPPEPPRETPDRPPVEIPADPSPYGAPSFLDLVSILAEPVAVYLGDARLPSGESAEHLEMARLHIDLLDVLRQKTAGNLTAQELSVLEDVIYRLRMRYVQKRG